MNGSAPLSARAGRGFTLVEMTVTTAIVLVLAAILFPVIDGALEKSRQSDCMSNQRQLAINILSYSQDDSGMLPLPSDWVEATGLAADSGVFDCPSTKKVGTGLDPDYGINAFLYWEDNTGQRMRLPVDRVTSPGKVELTSDLKLPTKEASGNRWQDEFTNPFPQSYTMPGYSTFAGTTRHGPGVIVSYLDGHVKLLQGREMGAQGMTRYNIPPGYGRVYLDLARCADGEDARQAMQTFISFAATWMRSTGEFADGAWEITNGHLMTSAEGQTYDKNCIFNGASNYAVFMMEYECTEGSKVMMATPNDFVPMQIPPDPESAQHEKLTTGWQTIYHIDTSTDTFQAGQIKAITNQNIYAGYTPNTWVDLPEDSPARGKVISMPPYQTRFRVEALISFFGGEPAPFPTDPDNPKGWVITGNHNTGKQLYQNIDMTLSSLHTGQPILAYNGPYIANLYTAHHYGRILLKVAGGTARVKKVLWAPSL